MRSLAQDVAGAEPAWEPGPERDTEPVTPLLDRGLEGLRIAVASGYFKCAAAEPVYALDRVAAALHANRDIEIPEAERARSAAFIDSSVILANGTFA